MERRRSNRTPRRNPPFVPCPPDDEPALVAAPPQVGASLGRWRLFRDVLVFQGKLALDGLLDLFLGPVALAAALVGLLSGKPQAVQMFYDVLRLGKRFDRWINLFGGGERFRSGRGADWVVDQMERLVKEQHGRGGRAASTKESIDRWLDDLQGQTGVKSEDGPELRPDEHKRGDGSSHGDDG